MDLKFSYLRKGVSLKTLFVSCSALATVLPTFSYAQFSIMGALDSRPALKTPVQVKKKPVLEKPVSSVFPTQEKMPLPVAKSSLNLPANAPNILFSAEEIGFHKDLGVITAKGNVEIVHDERVLIADTVSYNQTKNIVSASGNVQIIEENGDVLFMEYLEISSDLKNGIAKELILSMADNSYIRAQNAALEGGRFTTVKDGTYSPCAKCAKDPERALAWRIKADEIKHDKVQRRIEYSDVFLEVYDVPVLYLPYFSHPDPSRKRETGLLTPSYGSRGNLGAYVTQPVFVDLSPSHDLTLEPTWYFDESQPHLQGEYRQFTTNGEMRLAGSLTYANGGVGATSAETEEFRGHIDSEGLFDINETWRWGFDLNHSTDETYIRRYGMKNKADNGHLQSTFYAEGFRQRNYMNASLSTYQEQRDLATEDLQDGKVEYQFNHVSQPQKTGAYWSLDGGFYGINRKNSTRTSRLAADTSWTLPYTSDGGDIYRLEASMAMMGYYSSNLHAVGLLSEYSGAQGRAVPSLSLAWRKPLTHSRLSGKANEIFEPIVNVQLAPNVGNNYKIPNEDSQDFEFDDTNLFKKNRFTGLDKYDGGQRVDYGFNWGVYGKEGGYSQMFVGQSYRLRDDHTYDRFSGLEDNISDIVGRVKVSPSDFLSVLYRYRLDKDDLSLNRSETSLSIGPLSSRFSLSHLFIEGTGDDSEYTTREEISGVLTNQISKNWYSSLDARYRMSAPEGNVTYGGRVGYQDECVTVYADVRRNFFEDRDISASNSFMVRVELKNLGGFSPL